MGCAICLRGKMGFEKGLRLSGREIPKCKVNQCPVPHSAVPQEMEEQETVPEVPLSEVFQMFQ